MAARQTTETLLAARAVLEGATVKEAITEYKVGKSSVYRLVTEYTPYNAANKRKLQKVLANLFPQSYHGNQ